MSDTGDLSFNINAEGEEAAARQIEEAFERAFRSAAGTMAKVFTAQFSKLLRKSPFEKWQDDIRAFGRAAGQATQPLEDSIVRVQKRLDAIRRDMADIRIPVEEFQNAVRLTGRLEDNIERFATSQRVLAQNRPLERMATEELRALTRLTEQGSLLARQLTDVRKTEFSKTREQSRVNLQSETRLAEAATKERIVLAQQEGAAALAATRRSTAQRLAIFRAFVGQVRALERGLGAVFRSTANVAVASFRGVGRALSGLSSVFRRSNTEMVAGLSGALGQREGRLFSSFRRQEAIVRSSIARQSVTLNRFEARASTGIAGVVSGRSQLGALLGGGLAIGGGFVLISKFRDLATASADFEQGLAVLDAQLNATDKQMVTIRQTAIDLGNDITLPGVSALDAAQGIQILSKQFGALGKGAIPAAANAAKGMLQLSRATSASAEDAAGVIGSAINVFGIEADKAVDVADQITGALTKAAGVGFGDFALSFRQAATTFAEFQKPALGAQGALVEFNTALAVLAKGGLVGSAAGTTLKQFFLQANRGTADAEAALRLVTKRAGEVGSVFFDEKENARAFSDSIGILREGLEGLSDEQRTATLQTIFGSRAIAAAAILTGASAKEYDKIRKGIQQQGLAAKIAAAQNTGLRGALDALDSVVETQAILIGSKLNVTLGNAVLGFAELFNKVLTGEGVFAVFRQAVIGASIGLGGLLVAKTAGEAIRFLAVAMRGLLTPFGIIGLLVAGIGAVFKIMLDRSEGLREAFGNLGELLRERFGQAVEFVKERLGDFGDFLATTVLPALDKVSAFIAEHLVRAFDAVVGFVRDQVIPRLREFATFITGTVLPAVRNGLARAFEFASDAISAFWRVAEPILRPAIDAFKALGEAIAGIKPSTGLLALGGVLTAVAGGFAVAGPIGALVAGAGAGVAAAFATGLNEELFDALGGIGESIVNALRGPLESAVNFISGFFTVDRLLDVGRGFLQIVEEIGRIIGSVVSDPRFIGALAGIVAAAALVVVRFTEGLARGIASNIPEWGRLFLAGLKEALSFALKGLGDALTGSPLALGIIAALLTAPAVIGRWRAAGAQAAQAAGTGFTSTFRRFAAGGVFAPGAGGLVRGGGAASFVTALFGGPGALDRAVISQMQRAQGVITRELGAMRRTLAAAGPGRALPINIDSRGVREAFNRLTADVGPAGLLGIRLRQAFSASIASLRGRSLAPLQQLRTDFAALGVGLGRSLATGIAGALAGGIAGFQTGQALGGQSLLTQILGVGGLALALGTINPLMGIAAGAAGILGVAFSNMGGDAEEAATAVRDLSTALRDSDNPLQTLTDQIQSDFADAGLDVQETLADLGFSITDFAESLVVGGTGFDEFASLIGGLAPSTAAFFETFKAGKIDVETLFDALAANKQVLGSLSSLGLNLDDIREAFQFLTHEGGLYSEAAKSAGLQSQVLAERSREAGEAAQGASQLFHEAFREPTRDELQPAIDAVQTAADLAGQAAQDARTKFEEFLGRSVRPTLRSTLDELIVKIGDIGAAVTGTNLAENVSAQVRAASRRLAARDFRTELNVIVDTAVTQGRIDLVDTRGDIERIKAQVEGELNAAVAAGTLTAEARAALQVEIERVFGDPQLRRKVRQALELEDAAAAAQAAADAVELKPDLVVKPNIVVPPFDAQDLAEKIRESTGPSLGGGGRAGGRFVSLRGVGEQTVDVPIKVRPVIEIAAASGADAAKIGQGIANLVAVGVASGAPRIAKALSTSLAGALQSGSSATAQFAQAGAAASAAVAVGIVSGSGTIIRAAQTVAQQAAASAQAQSGAMGNAGVTLGVSFAIGIASQAGSAASAGSSLSSAASGGASGGSLFGTGQNLAASFASGIRSMASAAASAAAAVAAAAVSAARSALGISSPSKVFRQIGRDIGEGLAEGLADSETTIESAVSEAVQSAIEAAQRRVPRQGVARAQAASQLFETLLPVGLPGGPSRLDLDQAFVGVREAITNLGSTFRSVMEPLRTQARDDSERLRQTVANKIDGLRERLSERLDAIGLKLEERREAAFQQAFGGGADLRRQRFDLGSVGSRLAQDLRQAIKDKVGPRELKNIFLGAGDEVRQFAQSLFESGASARRITKEVSQYRDQLVRAARANGLNNDEIQNLLQVLGLTDKQLKEFVRSIERAGDAAAKARQRIREETRERSARIRAELAEDLAGIRRRLGRDIRERTTLDPTRAAGRENRAAFTEAFQSIRDFGTQLLAAGTPINQVINRMKNMRDAVIAQARSLGFNNRQIQELVRLLGLTDAQLAEFLRQLEAVNKNIANPPKPPPGPPQPGLTIGPGGRLPEGFRELHVHVPFGDPEAIGLSVLNATAFELPTPA